MLTVCLIKLEKRLRGDEIIPLRPSHVPICYVNEACYIFPHVASPVSTDAVHGGRHTSTVLLMSSSAV